MQGATFQSVFLLILGIFILFSQVTIASDILTPEMVENMKYVSNPKIQPQGNYIAYRLRVSRDDSDEPGGPYYELWVVPTQGGEPKQYVGKPNSVSSINWTPEGSKILFLDKRKEIDKHKQVYAIHLRGGEAFQFSHAPRNISDYALSPNGNYLAYTMETEEPKEVKQAKERGYDQEVEDTWSTIKRIYLEDLATHEVTPLSSDTLHVWGLNWTPDSKHVIFRASKGPFTDDKYMFTDNYIVFINEGGEHQIYDTDGKLEIAKLSPDGKYFAWLGAVSFDDPFPGSLFIMTAKDRKPVNLMEGFQGTGEKFIWKDESTIFLRTIEKNRTYLYEVSIPDGKMRKLLGDTGPIFEDITLADDKEAFTTVGNTAFHPNEVFYARLGKSSLKRLTNSNPHFADMQFGKQKTISWQHPDGLTIYGVLIKPVGYVDGKRYPLQVHVHGGPESAYLDGWNTYYHRWVQMLAQRGYMVLIPNYRASIGRGDAYSMADHKDLMGKEFEDILAGIDYLVDKGMVEPARVGIGGGSYGGYASAWAATKHSDRFAASVVFVGISNQISKAGMTDIPVENAEVHWDLWLYDNFDFVWERSPLSHIKNAQTPTLILHGKEDKRVPLNQAFELYRGLKYMNVPTELVVYPREGHGNKERAHRIDLCRRVLEWYDKYLKGAAAE